MWARLASIPAPSVQPHSFPYAAPVTVLLSRVDVTCCLAASLL
jgi:hypothetical protein